jgi:hypothetical protein
MRVATVPCHQCGRQVVDGSTDFGGGFLLRPTCQDIEVVMRGEVICIVTRDELRDFLKRAYG